MNYVDLTEKRLTGELIYDGQIVHLWRDEVCLPDGKCAVREVVRHIGAVAIVPLTSSGEVLCVEQYRYPFARVLLEIPAGKLDSPDEVPEEAAWRELREETGAVGGRLVPLGDLYPSVGICDEVIHMYAAVGFDLGSTDPDDDEFLRTRPVALGTLVDMIMNGEVTDAKTQAAVLKTARLRDMGKL